MKLEPSIWKSIGKKKKNKNDPLRASLKELKIKIEIGAEVGAIGASYDIGLGKFKLKAAYLFGLSLGVSW